MRNLPHQRRASDRPPERNNGFTHGVLLAVAIAIAAGALVLMIAVGISRAAAAATTVDVLHPNWHLVCTLDQRPDAVVLTCSSEANCHVTVHCHGGTLFTNGFDGGAQ